MFLTNVKFCDFVSADEHIVRFFDLLDVIGQLLLKLVSHLLDLNGLYQFIQVVLKGSEVFVLWWSIFRFKTVCLFFWGSVSVFQLFAPFKCVCLPAVCRVA